MTGKLHASKHVADVVRACRCGRRAADSGGNRSPRRARGAGSAWVPRRRSCCRRSPRGRLRALFNAADVAIFTTFTVVTGSRTRPGCGWSCPRRSSPAWLSTETRPSARSAPATFSALPTRSIAPGIDLAPHIVQALARAAAPGARASRDDVFVDGSGAAAVRPLPADCDSAGGGAAGRRRGGGAGMSVTVAAAAPVRTSLGGTAVRGVAWLFAQNVGNRFMVLAGQMPLARLLSAGGLRRVRAGRHRRQRREHGRDFGVQDVVLQRQRALRRLVHAGLLDQRASGGRRSGAGSARRAVARRACTRRPSCRRCWR